MLRIFITIILLIAVVVGGIIVFQRWQAVSSFAEVGTDSLLFGNPNGSVTVIEYLDFKCPYCPQVHKILEQAMAGDDRVRLIMRPIAVLGDESVALGTLVLAANKQGNGKGQALAKTLLANQGMLDATAARTYASQLGIDILQLESDMNENDVRAAIATSIGSARALGVEAVPTYFFGETQYTPHEGMPTVEDFKRMINDAAAKAK